MEDSLPRPQRVKMIKFNPLKFYNDIKLYDASTIRLFVLVSKLSISISVKKSQKITWSFTVPKLDF